MPPGYAAFFLWVASAVLWWSGWREETADGIPDAAVAVFLAGWPLAAWRSSLLTEGIWINWSFVWAALAMLALYAAMERSARWMSMSAGLLAGSIHLVLSSAETLPYTPEWLSGRGAALTVGLAAGLLVKGASGQIAAVTLSLMVNECLPVSWADDPGSVRIGTGTWMESWWIAVLSARLASVSAAALRTRFRILLWRREGEGS